MTPRLKPLEKIDRHTNLPVLVLFMLVGVSILVAVALNQEMKNIAKNVKAINHRLDRQGQTIDEIDQRLEDSQERLKSLETTIQSIDYRRRLREYKLVQRGGHMIDRLDRYLAGSPLAGQGRTFYMAAVDTGLAQQMGGQGWKLMAAQAGFESIKGRSALARNNNNFFGRRSASGGWRSYRSKEEAIYDQARYMMAMYFNKGRTTLVAINRIYAPGGGENSTWAANVAKNMASI